MKLRVALILLYDSRRRVLLQHRTEDAPFLPGYWGFFGGGIKDGETPEEAVIRETEEELDYKLRDHELFIEQNIRLPNADCRMFLFVAPLHGGREDLRLNEGQGWGWFEREDIDTLKMMEHDKKAVRSALDHIEGRSGNDEGVLAALDNACANDDREDIKRLLGSVESDAAENRAYQKVIAHYEQQGLFPVGYHLSFIRQLILRHDFRTANEHIWKCVKNGVDENRIADIVYEYEIRPNEEQYRKTFNRNLELLKNCGILFSDAVMDFDTLKKGLMVISDTEAIIREDPSEYEDLRILMADITDTVLIAEVFKRSKVLYLVYGDLKKFCYLLFFEDLPSMKTLLETKKLLFFAGDTERNLEGFFSNVRTLPPDLYAGLPEDNEYRHMIDGFISVRMRQAGIYLKESGQYYKRRDRQYYRNLFSGDPSGIRIMLITSEDTELNKYITRNWQDAFLSLGYQCRLLLEHEPFETMNNGAIFKALHEYRPDIVFHVNYSADLIFNQEDISWNLLWIMRYRDITENMNVSRCGNMFISSMVKEWTEDLNRLGQPRERLMYTPDGVNLEIFTKHGGSDERYACELVSVNNSGGDEFNRLTFMLDRFDESDIKQAIHELYAEIEEMGRSEQFIFFDRSYQKLLDRKMERIGVQLNANTNHFIVRFLTLVMFAIYRRRVLEWIIDAGITDNIKVWGRGWSNHDKFRKYHMGTARHGEELARIYGSSLISVSDHPNIPTHERTFEILASGGFPLVKHVEPENGEDIDYLTNYFRENEEIVMFYDKEDFLNKIQYYLDHPEEREMIAEKGRKVVLREFSARAVAEKTMSHIRGYYVGK